MNYFFWTKYPFVQIGFAFIGGNALAYALTDLPEFMLSANRCYYFLSTALVIACCALLLILYQQIKRIPVNGFLVSLLFIYLGAIRFLTYDERLHTPSLHALVRSESSVLGEVITEPEHKNNSIHFVLQVQKTKQEGAWENSNAKIKVTLADTSWHINFRDVILLHGNIHRPSLIETPYDFNYARWLAHQNIHYTLYTKTKPQLINVKAPAFSMKYYAIKARQKLEYLLTKKIKHPRAYALVTGLLIGKRSDLGEEDKQLFTISGTIHVLAVSGMHVVLIYQCLCYIALLLRIRTHGLIFNLCVLTLIWFYIFITGIQASASRAAIMISLVLLAKLMQRDNQNTNSLFATACLMLLYNPYYLADVGFILSFLAVVGILIFSSLSITEGKSKISSYLFNASLISTAAQTATFPYSVHLFQQFPVYFLLANLIIVPLTTLLLFLSVLLLVLYTVPYVSDFLVLLIEVFTDLLFYILQGISYLPWPIISHISLSTIEMLLLYGGLFMGILLFAQRNIKWSWGIAITLTLLCGSLHYRMISESYHPAIFISGKQEHRQYLLSSGRHAWVLQDQEELIQRTAEAFITDHFITDYRTLRINSAQPLILQQNNHQWAILRKKPTEVFIKDLLLQKCDAWILDYTIKYSYIDPYNKPKLNKKILPLYSKKSFYSTISHYELDTD